MLLNITNIYARKTNKPAEGPFEVTIGEQHNTNPTLFWFKFQIKALSRKNTAMYKECVIIGFIFLAIGIPFVTHANYDYSINFEIRNEFLSIFEIGIPLTIMSAGVTLTLVGFAMKKPER